MTEPNTSSSGAQRTPPTSTTPSPGQPGRNPEPAHHCFICLVDSGEEGDTKDWVNPCPCALEAHHGCLLKWIDESQGDNGGGGSTLECPQCKAPIRAVGAHDPVVAVGQRIRQAMGWFSPLFVSSSLVSTFAVGQVWYGKMAAGIFFHGRYPEVVELSPLTATNLATMLGYACIMPSLVWWNIFPSFTVKSTYPLSILYLSSQVGVRRNLAWPPDPDVAFACIPHLALAYQAIRWKILGSLERSWDRVLYGTVEEGGEAPRNRGLRDILGAVVDDLGRNDEPVNDNVRDGRVDVQLVIEVDDVGNDAESDDWEDSDDSDDEVPDLLRENGEVEPRPEGEQAPPPRPEPEPERQPEPAQAPPRQAEPAAQQNNRAADQQRGARRPGLSLVGMLIKVSVALALPSISYTFGELLRLVLPQRYTFPPRWGSRPGLLQQTWGRSFVGGIMFFVVKDMFQTYLKYRRAAIKPLRRVPSVPRRRRS